MTSSKPKSGIQSATLIGIDAYLIEIEIDSNKSLPGETIIGLPDAVIKESKNRVKSAIKSLQYDIPNKHYIINLSPSIQMHYMWEN